VTPLRTAPWSGILDSDIARGPTGIKPIATERAYKAHLSRIRNDDSLPAHEKILAYAHAILDATLSSHFLAPTLLVLTAYSAATSYVHASKLEQQSLQRQSIRETIDSLFKQISSDILPFVPVLMPTDLSKVAWAFATLGIRDNRLFAEIAHVLSNSVYDVEPAIIARTAWSFATLGITNQNLFDAIASRASRSTIDFTPRNLANSAWAFAFGDPSRVKDLVCRQTLHRFTNPQEWLQVYHALVVAGDIGPSEHFQQLSQINRSHQIVALNSFEQTFQKWFEFAFAHHRWRLHSQAVFAGIAVDFVVTHGRCRLIIECDGDLYHLSRGIDGGVPLGRDIIQDRVLNQFGYKVLHVRFSEFSDRERRLAIKHQITEKLKFR
jgi:very-short-patch-repair endonuclease